MEVVKVGMADLKVVKYPNNLTTLGLGSCVGIALYDKKTKIAGLVHIMLPNSKEIKKNSNKAKFADTGIQELIKEMEKIGAIKRNIVAKIAGGAQMFNFNTKNSILRIGERNAISARENLKKLKIPIIADDTGGNFGRTIELRTEDGILKVKTIGHGVTEI
ncbi:chemotaxis protein CheD [Clostridiaceae bacterium M8S5]|nr:chemotaxis protein CheD [Clostridiaceae bacterium M8S5]